MRPTTLPFVTVLAAFLFGTTYLYAQAPAIEWQKTYGGTGLDDATCIQQTSDGGYIVSGRSESKDGDVTGNHGSFDYWIVKLTNTGAITWEKSFGGSDDDVARCVRQTNDGGYIVVGQSKSTDGDVTGNHGNYDFWIVKLTSSGTLEWEKALGGTGDDEARSIIQTSDGGYIVVGFSNSTDGDVTGNHGGYDDWIVKLSSVGAIEWEKSFGGTLDEQAFEVKQTNEGGYIVSGYAFSGDGDVTGHHGGQDYWIIKLSNTGVIEWNKCYGGTGDDWSTGILQTSDGGYVVSGKTTSTDGDVKGNHGQWDFWVVRITSTGEIVWQIPMGGSQWDRAETIQPTSDGGFLIPGYSLSDDGDVTGHHGAAGSPDVWVVKVSSMGKLLWEKSLGGSDWDYGNYIQQTTDGGYILAGPSISTDGNVTGQHGGGDFWVVKLAATSDVDPDSTPAVSLDNYPNPFTLSTHIMAPDAKQVRICNMLGVEVTSLGESAPGEFIWTPPTSLQAGIYFAIIEGAKRTIAKSLVLTR